MIDYSCIPCQIAHHLQSCCSLVGNECCLGLRCGKHLLSPYWSGQTWLVPGGWGSQIFDSHYVKVVRLSALRTGRLYPPRNIPGTHFCQRQSRRQGHSAAGRIMSMENSNDTIGNRTRDLPACMRFHNRLRHRVPLFNKELKNTHSLPHNITII